jgi:hypothetical protein
MDKFFNSTFDALTNVVPGSMIIASLILFDSSLFTIDDILSKLNKIELGSAAILVFTSYVIGFAISPLGKYIYQKIGFKLWPMKANTGNSELSISDKYVLVRQFSQDNFKYIESWNMFCNLAHNLAIASIVVFFASIFRLTMTDNSNPNIFVSLGVVSFILFFLFLKRSVIFRIWAINDLNAAVDRLELLDELKSGPKRYDIKLTHE